VGTIIIAVMIMISTFGCNNGLILSGARVYYTMAKDGVFFKKTGTLNKSLVYRSLVCGSRPCSIAICLSGRYGDLLDMISFRGSDLLHVNHCGDFHPAPLNALM
jgi:APA family basic amino acid/polyamine antiporter